MSKEDQEVIEEIEKSGEKANKDLRKVNKELGKSSSLISKLGNGVKNIARNALDITETLTGATWGLTFAGAAKDAWDLNNSMTALSAQMGKGADGVAMLEGSVSGMMKNIGSSYKDAANIVSSLAEAKYEGDLTSAAQSVDMYSRATGVAQGTTIQFTNSLNKQAGMSTKATTALLAGMTNVQQKVGISKNGMEELTSSIIDMSTNMAAFGKSSDEIKAAAVKTTALVGAMEKVGVSAQETLSIMDRLTDPTRIEENVLLYSQLGISMQDAMSGNVEITDDMLSQLGEKIKSMGPIAGNAMAQSLGVSYKQLVKMSNATEGIVSSMGEEANVSEETANEKLMELMQKTEGFGKKVSNFFNKLKGYVVGLGPVILSVIALIPMLFKKRMASVFTDAKKDANDFAEGVGDSFFGKAKKTMSKIKKNVKNTWEGSQGKVKNSPNESEPKKRRFTKFAETGAKIKSDQLKDRMNSNLTNYESVMSKRNEYEEGTRGWTKYTKLGEEINAKAKKETGLNIEEYQKAIKASKELETIQERIKQIGDEKEANEKNISDIVKKIKANEKLMETASEGQKEAIKRQNAELNDQMLKLKNINKEKKEELESLDKSTQKYKEQSKLLEKMNKQKSLPDSGVGRLFSGIKDRISAGVGNWKNNIMDERTKAGKRNNGFVGKVGLAKDMTKSIGGKVIGKIGLAAGAISAFSAIATRFLPGLMEQLKPLIDDFLPIVKDLLNSLVKSLLPPMLKVMKTILSITMPIIEGISWVLSKLLGWVPGIGGALKGINQAAKSLHSKEFLEGIDHAAERIETQDLTKAIKESNDIEKNNQEEGEGEGAIINVSGGEAVLASTPEPSSVEVPSDEISEDELRERAKNDSNNEKNYNEMKDQTKYMEDNNSLMEILIDEVKNLARIFLEQMHTPIPEDVRTAGEQ